MIEFRFTDFFYPRDLLKTYFLMRRTEYWGKEQFQKYQSEHLVALLRYCGEGVDYYKKLFKESDLNIKYITAKNAFEYLGQLPILDKDTVRESPDLFISGNAKRYHPVAITTSGTTGTPLTVYWDRGSNVMEFCSIQRLWRWAGFHIGEPFLDLRSRVFEQNDSHLMKKNGITYVRNWKVNGLEFSSDKIDENNIDEYYYTLLKYKPRLVRGHPQSIHHLLNLLQKKGLDGWKPKAVTPASETIYSFQREQMEKTWQAPILDSYGLKEHNVFVAQCREGSYHIFPEYGICEIVNDNWQPVAPGEEGWVIATGLHNYAQPLLRYNTRDRAVAGDDSVCACGRTLPTIKRIIGRIDDCIYTSDGKQYSGMHFAFFGRIGIKAARLVQENYEKVKVEIIASSEFVPEERAKLLEVLENKVENKLKFELIFVDDIKQEASGKFKFVVSKLKKNVKSKN